MPGTSENDIVILSALELLQGMLLLHPPSRSLFSREIYLNILLDLLDSANPPALQSQALLVLMTALLECPRNARAFEEMDGLVTVAYEMSTVQRTPSKSPTGFMLHARTNSSDSYGSSMDIDDDSGMTRSTNEKKAHLEKWLGNVDWLVQDLPGGVPLATRS
jgi:hypothetical protein